MRCGACQTADLVPCHSEELTGVVYRRIGGRMEPEPGHPRTVSWVRCPRCGDSDCPRCGDVSERAHPAGGADGGGRPRERVDGDLDAHARVATEGGDLDT